MNNYQQPYQNQYQQPMQQQGMGGYNQGYSQPQGQAYQQPAAQAYGNYIDVVLNQKNVYPGKTISGTVFLGVRQPEAGSLTLIIEGVEMVRYPTYEKVRKEVGANPVQAIANIGGSIQASIKGSIGGLFRRDEPDAEAGWIDVKDETKDVHHRTIDVTDGANNNSGGFGGIGGGFNFHMGANAHAQAGATTYQAAEVEAMPINGRHGKVHPQTRVQKRGGPVYRYEEQLVKVEDFYQLFKEEMNLSGTLSTGDYSFPFSFTLPEDLPSTFYWVEEGDREARVYYTVSAYYGSLQETEEMILQQNYPGSYLGYRVESTSNSKCCCTCCRCRGGSGIVKLKSTVNKEYYLPHERIETTTKIINEGSSNFRVVSLKANLETWLILYGKGAVPYKRKLEGGEDKTYNIPIVDGKEITEADVFTTIGMEISPMMPTCLGTIIRCEYIVNINARCEACCDCEQTRNPVCKIPLIVCQKPVPEKQPQPPQGFSPQPMQNKVVPIQKPEVPRPPRYNVGVMYSEKGEQPKPPPSGMAQPRMIAPRPVVIQPVVVQQQPVMIGAPLIQ